MRKLLFIFPLLWMFCLLTARAQTFISVGLSQPPLLVADAGTDPLICPWDSTILGGSPSASGGSGSGYTYDWTPTSGLSASNVANPTASPGTTMVYYLTVTDANRCSSMDSITVVVDTCVGVEPASVLKFDVYPNPSQGRFTVDAAFPGATGNGHLVVSDALGKPVYLAELPLTNSRGSLSIDLSGLSKGVYFLSLRLGGESAYRKVILR